MRPIDYNGHPANHPQNLQEPQPEQCSRCEHRKAWHQGHTPKSTSRWQPNRNFIINIADKPQLEVRLAKLAIARILLVILPDSQAGSHKLDGA